MDSEPGTSDETNEQMRQSEIRQGTKELTTIPPFTYELMQKHLEADPKLVKKTMLEHINTKKKDTSFSRTSISNKL